ncbi:hypothetical protein [Arthrobacter globiformis]|uniref:hypothetical protein n=1 Tax=Arthrobacter globiformis TaxID=1665 RepID=UPI002790CF55|nr:hypothetical protein [Arthrobacter globiformis]MDQ0620011.1 hypothetical protein [Arthrobacter globiformis]
MFADTRTTLTRPETRTATNSAPRYQSQRRFPARRNRAALRTPTSRKQTVRLFLLGVLCTAGWLASLLAGHFAEFGPELHRIGLAAHILALVLSFGTILVVDWLGLLWLMGKVHMHESPKLEAAAKPLIWGGLALLLASGALIQPDITNPVTAVKLGCVLVLMLNGLSIAPAMHKMFALPRETRFSELGRRLRLRLLIALSISQACWWTAVLIGLVNSTLRRWTGM